MKPSVPNHRQTRQRIKRLVVRSLHLEGLSPEEIGDDQPLFNLGGRLEDIRARCEEETRLPAPVKPTFVKAG